mmetsp:Transcript_36359/g.109108  ORF Transcript_36359/g.109108 Transcript_36359/m.109108 type:complete len:359 (-) Transcript_36359:392-1468(-)
MRSSSAFIAAALCAPSLSSAFVQPGRNSRAVPFATTHPSSAVVAVPPSASTSTTLRSTPEDPNLQRQFGGYTVKQRLREEVESPFRTVRLFFFGSSTGSAFVALYFSFLSLIKANVGTYADAPSMDEALTNCGINLGALIVCGALTYRDWMAGEANLARIAKGGKLASLVVSPASSGGENGGAVARITVKEYRRNARVLIAAGGKEYIEKLALSLNSDQRSDDNTLARALEDVDVVVVPVLLEGGKGSKVGDTRSVWTSTEAVASDSDRNFDISRSDNVVAFPVAPSSWYDYLESEIKTASGQGFDVVEKGFTITVKKNGRILRRATGLPQWEGLVGTMEIMDGSKFGMPGDDEKYGS